MTFGKTNKPFTESFRGNFCKTWWFFSTLADISDDLDGPD